MKSAPQNKVKMAVSKSVVKCNFCNKHFPSIEMMNIHKQNAHKKGKLPPEVKRPAVTYPGAKKTVLNDTEMVQGSKTLFLSLDGSGNDPVPVSGTAGHDDSLYSCTLCNTVFDGLYAMHKHIYQEHKSGPNTPLPKDILKKINAKDIPNTDSRYISHCNGCQRKFPTNREFNIHVSEAHRDEVDCLYFTKYQDFKAWRDDVERESTFKYLSSEKHNKRHYYRCGCREYFVLHETGDKKNFRWCPSTIMTQIFLNGIQVHYYRKHYGHSFKPYIAKPIFKKHYLTRYVKNEADAVILSSPDSDLYEQYKTLMDSIVVEAAKINSEQLYEMFGRALDLTVSINQFHENVTDDTKNDDESDITLTTTEIEDVKRSLQDGLIGKKVLGSKPLKQQKLVEEPKTDKKILTPKSIEDEINFVELKTSNKVLTQLNKFDEITTFEEPKVQKRKDDELTTFKDPKVLIQKNKEDEITKFLEPRTSKRIKNRSQYSKYFDDYPIVPSKRTKRSATYSGSREKTPEIEFREVQTEAVIEINHKDPIILNTFTLSDSTSIDKDTINNDAHNKTNGEPEQPKNNEASPKITCKKFSLDQPSSYHDTYKDFVSRTWKQDPEPKKITPNNKKDPAVHVIKKPVDKEMRLEISPIEPEIVKTKLSIQLDVKNEKQKKPQPKPRKETLTTVSDIKNLLTPRPISRKKTLTPVSNTKNQFTPQPISRKKTLTPVNDIKNLLTPIKSKKFVSPNSAGKRKTKLRTKLGQFTPGRSPKRVSLESSPNSSISGKLDKIEYEVLEQENDCNILILKI